MKAAALALMSFLAVAPGVASERCPMPRLATTDYEAIQRALERESPPIASVDAFLDCLPDEFFEHDNLTYVSESRSPERREVDVSLPRSILFGDRAETIVAYTASSNELGIVVADDDPVPHWRFVSVSFPGGGRAARVDESGARCVACHNGHPIWGSYRKWDGTYSVASDRVWMEQDRAGSDAYEEFRLLRSGSARYARGIAAAEREPARRVPGAGAFLRKIVPHHARVVAAGLDRSALGADYRFLLAGTFLGCDWGPAVEADFERLVVDRFRGDPIWREHADALVRMRRNPADRFARNALWLARLKMMAVLFGVPPEAWGFGLAQAGGPSFGLGSGIEMRDHVFRAWIAGVGRENDAVAAAFSGPEWRPETTYASFLNPHYRERTPLGEPEHVEECRALQPFLESETAWRVEDVPAPVPASAAGRCAACHSSEVVAGWLTGERELLARRLLVDRDMPPGGLSDPELAAWRELLDFSP